MKKLNSIHFTFNYIVKAFILFLSICLSSCLGEAKEKFSQAKEGVSNATTIIKEAQKVEGRIEKLKNATPLTSEQLKEWLPKSLGALERTGFKVGQAGMYQVNSIEGTFKKTDGKQKFNVMIIDDKLCRSEKCTE